MSTGKHIDKICIAVIAVTLVLTVFFMNGEKLGIEALADEDGEGYFSRNDILSDWDTSDAAKITLSDDGSAVSGNGAYVKDGDIHIVYAGRYVVTGSLSDGKIIIDADGDDKIWLMLSGADITCKDSAAILVEQADKVFLTLADGTENRLSSGEVYSDEAESAGVDGVIYSRDDLTINGGGTLAVFGEYRHGIVCNDSLKITSGSISVTAKEDAVHVNDDVCIREAVLELEAGDDGITVADFDASDYMYIESGDIKITGCYEGLEATTVTVAGGNIGIYPTDDGINAQSLIEITGGSVKIVNENGRDADGLDSNRDVVISGGKVFISVPQSGGSCAVDYGSENMGEFRIDGGTVIACGSNTMLEAVSADSKQAFIMKNISGGANTSLTLEASDGAQLISETIPVGFSAVIVSTSELKNGEVCTITAGSISEEITVDSTSEIGRGGFGGGGIGGGRDFGRGSVGDSGDATGGKTMPGREGADGAPPEIPDGGGQPGAYDSPLEISGGENDGGMQRPDVDFAPSVNGDRPQNGGRNDMRPDENTEYGTRDVPLPESRSGAPDAETMILLGISVLVLAAGIFIAFKKKY